MHVLLNGYFQTAKKTFMCIWAQQPGPWFRLNDLTLPDARGFFCHSEVILGYEITYNYIQL